MARQNPLLTAPPYAVEQGIRQLGANLRTARLRRNLTLETVASRIGTHRRVIGDAEAGKPSTAIGVYVALLWAYDLLGTFEDLANPLKDEQGLALASRRDRVRARRGRGLDNDF